MTWKFFLVSFALRDEIGRIYKMSLTVLTESLGQG